MDIFIRGQGFAYEIENIARMFGPVESVREGRPDRSGDFCYARVSVNSARVRILCCAKIGDASRLGRLTLSAASTVKDSELAVSRLLYKQLCSITGKTPPWGVMTGVRPAKFANMLFSSCGDYAEVSRLFKEKYCVSAEKTALAVETAKNGARIAAASGDRDISVYVSIPFCPTRCDYCSFVSKTTQRDGALVEPYLEALFEELRRTAEIVRRARLNVMTVYVGGGTPSVLSASQLGRLCACIGGCFDIASLAEFTVEAGRPDTVTREKLDVLKAAGVTRVSINPQTFSDDVLRAVGRRHTSAETERAYAVAREVGFHSINMDLIAGLPTDNPDGFKHSLDRAIELAPQNITVHALTLKRASNLTERGEAGAAHVHEMVDYSQLALAKAGYLPYYLYKQKGTVENLENVGFSKAGFEGLYNVFMMDEIHTVASCGAAAVTKLIVPRTGEIERVFNFKYPAEYINGLQVILSRKDRLEAFYESRV